MIIYNGNMSFNDKFYFFTALPAVLQKVRFSLEKFEDSLKPDLALTSGKNKMINRMISTIENALRLSLHRLKYLVENPMSRFLQSNNSHIGSQVYVKICTNFFESEVNQCPDRNNSFTTCVLHEMSVILSKLLNIINALNFSWWSLGHTYTPDKPRNRQTLQNLYFLFS